jgi:hypothetical protein
MSTELILLIVIVGLIIVIICIFKLIRELSDEDIMVFTKKKRDKVKEESK